MKKKKRYLTLIKNIADPSIAYRVKVLYESSPCDILYDFSIEMFRLMKVWQSQSLQWRSERNVIGLNTAGRLLNPAWGSGQD